MSLGPGVSKPSVETDAADGGEDTGPELVALEDVPDQIDPTGGTAAGRVAPRTLLREEDPEAFCDLMEEKGISRFAGFCGADEAPDEEADEPSPAPDLPPTPADIQQQGADPERFDQTFLARSENFRLKGRFSPTGFPLQVLPRVAYTINYNFVWNPDRERWEPKKKGEFVIDDFEDGDLDEYSGDLSLASVQSSTVKSGDLALRLDVQNGTNTTINSQPGDGLNTYPEKGDEFQAFARGTGDANQEIAWYDPDNSRQYEVTIRRAQSEFKIDAGNVEKTASVSIAGGEWQRVVIAFGESTISARLEDAQGTELASLSGSESDTGDNKLRIDGNTPSGSATAFWDDIRVVGSAD